MLLFLSCCSFCPSSLFSIFFTDNWKLQVHRFKRKTILVDVSNRDTRVQCHSLRSVSITGWVSWRRFSGHVLPETEKSSFICLYYTRLRLSHSFRNSSYCYTRNSFPAIILSRPKQSYEIRKEVVERRLSFYKIWDLVLNHFYTWDCFTAVSLCPYSRILSLL